MLGTSNLSLNTTVVQITREDNGMGAHSFSGMSARDLQPIGLFLRFMKLTWAAQCGIARIVPPASFTPDEWFVVKRNLGPVSIPLLSKQLMVPVDGPKSPFSWVTDFKTTEERETVNLRQFEKL